MATMAFSYTNISNYHQQLQQGTVTCTQAVQHYLQQIERHKNLNIFLSVYQAEALAQAAKLDAQLQQAQTTDAMLPLHGLVVAVKAVICQQGKITNAASNMLANFKSLYTATALQRLIDAGAIIIGSVNCDEFAMGSTGENSAFGATLHPQNPKLTPGGSSGGSAAAVAAGCCMAALGTDTGGSVRQPAAFCGIVGTKPTYGRISRHGLIAYASSFDQIGTLTHSVEDAAYLLHIMAGHDPLDSTSLNHATPNYPQLLPQAKDKKYHIAYFKESLNHPGLNTSIQSKTQAYIKALQAAGHQLTPIDFPHLNHLVPTYYILTSAEASTNLSRYDGVRYGHRSKQAHTLTDLYTHSRSEAFGTEVKKRIMLGTFVLSAGFYDAYYQKAQQVRQLIRQYTLQALKKYDFILSPTTPTTALPIGTAHQANPISVYLADIYTVQANLCGIPAISLPLLTDEQTNLPIGIQLMASPHAETVMLQAAKQLMQIQVNP